MPSLIAWLSLCLLSAAWGGTISGPWQNIWLQAGTFGLVASVGLGSLEKARQLAEQKLREQSLQLRVDTRLTEWNEQNTVTDSIKDAIEQITSAAKSTGRSLEGYPLEIVLIKEDETFHRSTAQVIPGKLDSFSASLVKFEHQGVVTEPVVMLVFDLAHSRELCLVASMTGTQAGNDGFISCAAVMAAGVPDDEA